MQQPDTTRRQEHRFVLSDAVARTMLGAFTWRPAPCKRRVQNKLNGMQHGTKQHSCQCGGVSRPSIHAYSQQAGGQDKFVGPGAAAIRERERGKPSDSESPTEGRMRARHPVCVGSVHCHSSTSGMWECAAQQACELLTNPTTGM